MRILALETSTEYCSVAVLQEGHVHAASALARQTHSERLPAMVAEVLAQAGLGLRALDGVAFGAGPGSFTGLRIACGFVQGLAFGLGLPVASVSTLEALAEGLGAPRVVVALDAHMGEVYLAAYQRFGERWRATIAPCLCRPDAAPIPEGHDWIGVGSGFAHGGILAEHYGARLARYEAQRFPEARHVATLGAGMMQRGEATDAAAAAPVYLRDRVAEAKPAPA
jgi:tRNA threonylcarbamoyladenosine biosynthesis protein TsaB